MEPDKIYYARRIVRDPRVACAMRDRHRLSWVHA
jgi:hypothetical protein